MAAKVKVDQIETVDGTGSITLNNDIAMAATKTLPAASLTGALPAISAASLTNVPAANITGTLPAIDGSNLTGVQGDFVTISSVKSEVDVANLDITLPTGYISFVLCGGFHPATDGQELHLRFSTDSASSYESGSDYHYGKFDISGSGTVAAEKAGSATAIVCHNGDGNATTEGSFMNIQIEPSIADASYNSYNSVSWQGYRFDGSGNFRALVGTGVFEADATTRATHLRLYYASGNVSEYHYTLFGRKS